ncbi:MAG: Wzz/FepE/Etk N-terminal domain-containing protein [Armatimonadota bacterium]
MEDINLIDYLQVIWRRRMMVIVIGIIILLVALVTLLLTPHTYRSKAVLIFPNSKQSSAAGLLSSMGVPNIGDFDMSSSNSPEMYMGILKSRTLSEEVGRELKLGKIAGDYSSLQNGIEVLKTKEGTMEIYFSVPSTWVEKGNPGIKLEGSNADEKTASLSAEMVNTYIRKLQEFDKDHSFSSGHRKREFLEKEVDKTRRELSAAENTLRKFKEANPALPPPETESQQVEQLISLRTMQIEAETEARETEKSIEEAKATVKDHETVIEASKVVEENAVVSQLKSKLADAEVLRASLLEDMTEKSPDVVAATHDIEKIKEQIKAEVPKITASETLQINPVRQELVQELAQFEIKESGVQARLDTLNKILTRVENEIAGNARNEMRYIRITRDVKALEAVYTSLLTQLSQAKVLEAKDPEGFTVLDWAVAEKCYYKPKVKITLAAACLLGLVMGCIAALIVESSRPTKKRKVARRVED